MTKKLPFVWNEYGALEGCPFDSGQIEILLSACPQIFCDDNPWSEYARKIIEADGIDISNWRWKDNSDQVQRLQLKILKAWLTDFIPHKNRLPVAGWMISEMLLEIPV